MITIEGIYIQELAKFSQMRTPTCIGEIKGIFSVGLWLLFSRIISSNATSIIDCIDSINCDSTQLDSYIQAVTYNLHVDDQTNTWIYIGKRSDVDQQNALTYSVKIC